MARSNGDILIPAAAPAVERLKLEVASDLGVAAASEAQFRQGLDQAKFEVAASIGVPLVEGDNGGLTSRAAGAIGGRLGGHLGGQMVRRMIALAETHLAEQRR